jgi:hypothetical protein
MFLLLKKILTILIKIHNLLRNNAFFTIFMVPDPFTIQGKKSLFMGRVDRDGMIPMVLGRVEHAASFVWFKRLFKCKNVKYSYMHFKGHSSRFFMTRLTLYHIQGSP